MNSTQQVAFMVKKEEWHTKMATGGQAIDFLIEQLVILEERLARAEASLKSMPHRMAGVLYER